MKTVNSEKQLEMQSTTEEKSVVFGFLVSNGYDSIFIPQKAKKKEFS